LDNHPSRLFRACDVSIGEAGVSASAPAMNHDVANASEPQTAAIAPSASGTSQDPAAFAIPRGDEVMARGDIVSARRFYKVAAAKGVAGQLGELQHDRGLIDRGELDGTVDNGGSHDLS
jgi:hypothetical protein